ncbi:MAG: AhpC/TSA family protein [Prolixibacteraceae bacterium]|nr:AhpC/TSA family protein [Prolixibacteraceae bacterium]
MNKTLALLAIVILMVSCGKKNNFTISGKIDGGAGKSIYLNHLTLTALIPVDSVKLDKAGEFKMKGRVSEPTYFLLKLSDGNFATLLVDSAENLTITGSFKQFASDYTVKGSDNSSKVRDLTLKFAAAKSKTDSLQKLYQKHQNDPLFTSDLTKWNSEYAKQVNDYTIYLNDFVKRNPFSMASVYGLYQKWSENNYVANDFQAMKTAASALYAVYPKNDQVKALYNNALTIIREQKNARLNDLMSQSAVNSPNIKLPDVSGITRDLWSLHGKNVLLHFWSAKDKTCRIQNQVLVELYAKYKSRGFEIFMVSVDDDKAAWSAAIAEDHLTWINVGDMKGSISALMNYNIHSVPANYLLDKEGKIVAKNLQGPELNSALAKIL